MENEPNEQKKADARAESEAAGYVIETIKHFTDDGRARVLNQALELLHSKLVVNYKQESNPRSSPIDPDA